MLTIQVGRCVPLPTVSLLLYVVCFLITRTQICSGTMICVSVFDKIANNLHQKLELAGLEPKVMVATNIKPKVAGGQYNYLF